MERSVHEVIRKLKEEKNYPLCSQSRRVIEGLLEEVERSSKLVEEYKQLIQIMREGKEYYEQEYKHNTFQEQCQKMFQENRRLGMIAEAHQKGNQELKGQVVQLQEEISSMKVTVKQQEKVISESQDKYMTLALQKQLLQKQWNKVLKAVNKKIAKIEREHKNPEVIIRSPKDKREREETVMFDKGLPLRERADKMLKFINDRIAIEELEELFAQKTSQKKTRQKQHENSPIPREALRQLGVNRPRQLFTLDFLDRL